MAGEQVERLLYDGETVAEEVAWDGARVVLTSHRLLVFTPELAGANYRAVDRPNVEGVGTAARARGGLLERGVRYGVVGVALIGAGAVVDLEGVVDSVELGGASTQLGLGGLGRALGLMLALLSRLDDLLRAVGALAVLLAVALLAGYWYTRTPTLTVAVAGGEDIDLPRPDGPARERVEGLIAAVEAGGTGPRDPGTGTDRAGESGGRA